MGVSLSTGASVAAVGVVLAGVAAAATLTTVFAPTQVARCRVSQADLQSSASSWGSTPRASLGGFRRAVGI